MQELEYMLTSPPIPALVALDGLTPPAARGPGRRPLGVCAAEPTNGQLRASADYPTRA